MDASVQEGCELIEDKAMVLLFIFLIPKSASHIVGVKKKESADWIKFIQTIADVEPQLKRC